MAVAHTDVTGNPLHHCSGFYAEVGALKLVDCTQIGQVSINGNMSTARQKGETHSKNDLEQSDLTHAVRLFKP